MVMYNVTIDKMDDFMSVENRLLDQSGSRSLLSQLLFHSVERRPEQAGSPRWGTAATATHYSRCRLISPV